jgi:hypothetical protein
MANLQNLKPWPKSVSGNPAGRPRNTKLTPALRELLGCVDPEDKAGRTYAEVIADAMIRRATRGDVRATREITVVTEGRARRRVPIETVTGAWDRVAESLVCPGCGSRVLVAAGTRTLKIE